MDKRFTTMSMDKSKKSRKEERTSSLTESKEVFIQNFTESFGLILIGITSTTTKDPKSIGVMKAKRQG